MTKSQQKRADHKAKFAKLGAAISAMRPTDDRDYTTGHESYFDLAIKPISDPLVSSRLFGPQTMTQQWERTTARH